MIAGLYGKRMFSFVRNCQSGCSILRSHQQWWEFLLFPILASIRWCQCSGFGCSDSRVVASYCCFNFHFPDDIGCGASFRGLICHLYLFLGEVSVQVFGPNFIQLFVFLLLSFKSFLYILDNSSLSDASFANIFSWSVVFLILLILVFPRTEVFNFNDVQHIN